MASHTPRVSSGLLSVLFCAVLLPGVAKAHPHEFVDTNLGFQFDEAGKLAAISVVWLYDDLTSLLILADLGMDMDGDGVLNPDEAARLQQMAGNWPEGFDGNLYLAADGVPLALSGPLNGQAGLRDGRIWMTHLRALTTRIGPELSGVSLQAYDPSYYIAYDLQGSPAQSGRTDCRISTLAADTAAAQALYDQAVSEVTGAELADGDYFPEIGGAFAATLRLECDALP
ncbi:DUF1007 family protein [Xinfangfangia sp. D13-10-4-6]|uniref:DUF1007 family protein n=1 Tax=Pseudogemmobacter hezensis TaxID=2737662 RepID=UPI001553D6ED|nr:DUF1007 family protein [Pseudogemmobacter hezensis]NPD15498.1 DUF1007 family protein [Pseudogemmobacter hezensis]